MGKIQWAVLQFQSAETDKEFGQDVSINDRLIKYLSLAYWSSAQDN